MIIEKVNNTISQVENTILNPQKPKKDEKIRVGVDLGTAYIVLTVLGEDNRALSCSMEFAQVIKDGLVVDYVGAQNILKKLKMYTEERIGIELSHSAIAVPPGTSERDSKTHLYVVEGTGMEVTHIADEPTAANRVLNIENGAVVDIGGGTTGVSIFKNGKVIHTADEASGGTHLSLVIAGRYKVSFEEAEEMKKDLKMQKEIFQVVRPVFEKMASIVEKQIQDKDVDIIYLVGGTCKMPGIEQVFKNQLGIEVVKPDNPLLVTPIGIAMNDGGDKI